MVDQIIPLTNSPNQTIAVSLNIDGGIISLVLRIRFNEMAQYWDMRISDKAGNIILDSVPLLTGDFPAANVLAQWSYLKIGSAYVINVSNIDRDYPGSLDFGTDFVLLWSDTPAQ